VIANMAAFALNAVVSSPSTRNSEPLYAEWATSLISSKELAVSQKKEKKRLTKPALNIHSCWSLTRTAENPSGVRAAEISSYSVRNSKAFLHQTRAAVIINSLSRCALKHFAAVTGWG